MKVHHTWSLFLFTAVAFSLPTAAYAAEPESTYQSTHQELAPFSLSYIISAPTGSTTEFLRGAVSYRGLGFEWDWRAGVKDLTMGVSLRWLYFRHVEDQGSLTSGNSTATGRIYSSLDSIPVAFHLKYPFASLSNTVLPYIGLGAGGLYGMRQLAIGTISQDQFGWQFFMAPEVGAQFKFPGESHVKANVGLRYDAGFGSDAIHSISYLSLAIGIAANY